MFVWFQPVVEEPMPNPPPDQPEWVSPDPRGQSRALTCSCVTDVGDTVMAVEPSPGVPGSLSRSMSQTAEHFENVQMSLKCKSVQDVSEAVTEHAQ